MAMSLRLLPACGLGQGSPELQAPAHPMTYQEPPTPSSPAWPQGWHPAQCLVFFEHCPRERLSDSWSGTVCTQEESPEVFCPVTLQRALGCPKGSPASPFRC